MNTEKFKKELITARISGQLFGFNINEILDVFIPHKITKVPLAASEISGVLNLRGRVVTVIDMYNLLNIEKKGQNINKIAVGISYKGELYSLLVDEIGEVLDLKEKNLEAIPDTLDKKWSSVTSHVYQLSDELLVLLNTSKIFEMVVSQVAA